MAEPSPTVPLPDGTGPGRRGATPKGRAGDAGGTGCPHGHGQPRNPTYDPRWGLVPTLSNAILGAVVLAVVLGLLFWLLPAAWGWAVAGLAVLGLAYSAAVQAALGHRRRCWAERTLRWWLGPLGAFWDPVDAG